MTGTPERQDPPPPACGTCGCPLARHGWKSRVDPRYCHGCNHPHDFVWADPDDELHARCAHPDWEYATTDGPRKAWYDADTPPEGDGWVSNSAAGDNGWERFDYHEESYWRRPKQAAVVLAVEPGANAEDDWPLRFLLDVSYHQAPETLRPGRHLGSQAHEPDDGPFWDGKIRRVDEMTDDHVDALHNTLAEVRRLAEKARRTPLPSQAANACIQAFAATILRALDGTTREAQP